MEAFATILHTSHEESRPSPDVSPAYVHIVGSCAREVAFGCVPKEREKGLGARRKFSYAGT